MPMNATTEANVTAHNGNRAEIATSTSTVDVGALVATRRREGNCICQNSWGSRTSI